VKPTINRDEYWWWSKETGWARVKQMNDRYLTNALKSLGKHGKSHAKGYYVWLREIKALGIEDPPKFMTC